MNKSNSTIPPIIKKTAPKNHKERKQRFFLMVILFLCTLIVYWRALETGFVFDDKEYLLKNPHVLTGSSWENIRWAFSSFFSANWHPLTWLSHMMDSQLFGMKPAGHHMISILLHATNSVLWLHLLYLMTGALWRSAAVSFFFALHPLRVESVVWVAERKDVLSMLFLLLALWAYFRYVRQREWFRYLFFCALFAAGLMAKPMIVTFPFLLLLLDWWPLGRMTTSGSGKTTFKDRMATLRPLLVEKIPLLILSAASTSITVLAQQTGGAIRTSEQISFSSRLANAAVVYVKYLLKFLWPSNLAVYYPHPGTHLPWWQVGGSLFALAWIIWAVIKTSHRRHYLAMGWFWYLCTLIPVIGLIQIGSQAMADRYTYLPTIGLTIAAVWGMADLLHQWSIPGWLIKGVVAVSLSLLSFLTRYQIGFWHNDEILFQRALAVTERNWLAHNNYGLALLEKGDAAGASNQFIKALEIWPDFDNAHYNLALAYSKMGKIDKAIALYEETLRLYPPSIEAHVNLGILLASRGRIAEAEAHYREALKINPESAGTHLNLGNILQNQGNLKGAMDQYFEALRLNPHMPEIHVNLGNAFSKMGKVAEALPYYYEALRLRPDYFEALFNLGLSLEKAGRLQEAVIQYRKALSIKPNSLEVQIALQRLKKLASVEIYSRETWSAMSSLFQEPTRISEERK